jgi:hypothetical protein
VQALALGAHLEMVAGGRDRQEEGRTVEDQQMPAASDQAPGSCGDHHHRGGSQRESQGADPTTAHFHWAQYWLTQIAIATLVAVLYAAGVRWRAHSAGASRPGRTTGTTPRA